MEKIRIRFWNKEIKDFAKITINDWENTDMNGVISYGHPNILTIGKDDKYDMDISSCFLDKEEKEITVNIGTLQAYGRYIDKIIIPELNAYIALVVKYD